MTVEPITPIQEPTLVLEGKILNQFRGLTKPKKIVKLAEHLYLQSDNELEKQICKGIATAKDPVAKVIRSLALYEDSCIIVEQFIEEGKHGLIVITHDVYPIEVKTVAKWLSDGIPWTEEEELDIQYKAAEDWMTHHDAVYFLGKVVLFSRFGFSGTPRLIELTLGKEEKA